VRHATLESRESPPTETPSPDHPARRKRPAKKRSEDRNTIERRTVRLGEGPDLRPDDGSERRVTCFETETSFRAGSTAAARDSPSTVANPNSGRGFT
jgi:hypothetical protein